MSPITFTIPASDNDTLVTITAEPILKPAIPPKLQIGTNVASNDPVNGLAAWCDVTRQATGWYSLGGAITYDAQGYPASITANGQAASWTYLYGYPAGNYAISWKGPKNALNILGKTIANLASDNAGGWTATVAFNTGDRVEFRTSGGISSVHLLAPDAKPGQTFREAYLALLRPYKVTRVMPMQRVNGIGLPPVLRTNWAQRVTPDQWDQTSREVAAELCVQLAVEAGTNVWLNVPYGAPDDFIAGLANVCLAKGVLSPAIEYSNELWNNVGMGGPYQGAQIRADALKLGKYGTDPNQAGARYHADLTLHMGSVVKAILPNAKIVFGAQATWEAWATDGLSWLGIGGKGIDALAVAPYFQTNGPTTDLPSVLASCQAWIDGPLANGLAKNAAVATTYGLPTWGYEFGESLIPNPANAPPVELQWQADISQAQYAAYLADPMRAAQLDPGIGAVYDKVVAACLSSGMTLACHFMAVGNWGRSGFWGLKQQTSDPENAKSQAISRAILSGNQ